jgi:hypothetical protein
MRKPKPDDDTLIPLKDLSPERWCGVLSRISSIQSGTSIDEALGTGSTSERCALALIYDRDDLLPYTSKGDAWTRLDDRQRRIVRQHNPRKATAAERAAARDAARGAAQSDRSRRAGRPLLGDRPMTPQERKASSRKAAGEATLEAIDRATMAEIQKAAASKARWFPGLLRAVQERFVDDADRKRVEKRLRG